MRHTKIVATIGPATRSAERLRAVIEAGVDVARLNFSHGSHDEHRATLDLVRQISQQLRRHVPVLQDLQGPKIRTGTLQSAPVTLISGREFTITTIPTSGTADTVSTSYADLSNDVKPGDRILLSDGLIELVVNSVTPTSVKTRVVTGGVLGEHTGINLPGVKISTPSLTPKDEDDLRFGVAIGVDYIALSFVRQAADVERARQLVTTLGATTPIIAKIEKPEALDHLDEIIAVSDGVMVARGDLGVEINPARVPMIQKRIVAAANRAGKPVIVATQMLESMIHNPRPTRAEASDVANAILDGTDAVMLSGETAIGEYPVETVEMMASIALEAERGLGTSYHLVAPVLTPFPFALAIAEAAVTVASRLEPSAIIAFSRSGFTARLVSKFRPLQPILAVAPDDCVARQINLYWGTVPVVATWNEETGQVAAQAQAIALQTNIVHRGDVVVITMSAPGAPNPGRTNLLEVVRIA